MTVPSDCQQVLKRLVECHWKERSLDTGPDTRAYFSENEKKVNFSFAR